MKELESYAKDDGTPDSKKTSLRPYIELFGKFVKQLLAKAPKNAGESSPSEPTFRDIKNLSKRTKEIELEIHCVFASKFNVSSTPSFQVTSIWTFEGNSMTAGYSTAGVHKPRSSFSVSHLPNSFGCSIKRDTCFQS